VVPPASAPAGDPAFNPDSTVANPRGAVSDAGSDNPAPEAEFETESEEETRVAAEELAEWKARLRYDFERWLSTVEAIPEEAEPGPEEDAPPDLYSFFEQLAVLNAESRRAHRRTAETLSQWGETLGRFGAELGRVSELAARSLAAGGSADRLARGHCLALIEVLDRLHRLEGAFARPPARSWWARDQAWRAAWENQRQAFQIVTDHVETLLRQEGVFRLDTVGQLFDPLRMAAVAADPTSAHPPQTVLEELNRGYRRGDEVLRVAQVRIAIAPRPS
jgi:hypothetical protein